MFRTKATAKLDHANGDAAIYAAHKRFQQEAVAPESRYRFALCTPIMEPGLTNHVLVDCRTAGHRIDLRTV
jgi:hypothetical protein